MAEKLYNMRCDVCQANCQASEVRLFEIIMESGDYNPDVAPLVIGVCEFCLMSPDEPIPFTVTGKGMAESMRQPARENEMLRAGSVEFPVPTGYSVLTIENILFVEEGRVMEKLTELHELSSFYDKDFRLGNERAALQQAILSASLDLANIRSALDWTKLARTAIARIKANHVK